jgi:hypothetical protein
MVMPDTPAAASASRTSSSLKGLMIAMISFMSLPRFAAAEAVAVPKATPVGRLTLPRASGGMLACFAALRQRRGE